MQNGDYGPAFLRVACRSRHLNKSCRLNERPVSHLREADNDNTLFGLLSSAATTTVCVSGDGGGGGGAGEDVCFWLTHQPMIDGQ